MIKIIFCDISGTLLNSNGLISKETIDNIQLLTKKGIRFVLCSGGSRIRTMNLASNINLQDYIISSNGADIYDAVKKEKIYINKMNDNSIINIYNLAISNNMFFTAHSNSFMLVNKKRFGKNFEKEIMKITIEDLACFDIVQCTITGDGFQHEKLSFIIDTLLNDENIKIAIKNSGKNICNINYTNRCYCDIVDKNTSKGDAANILLQKLNIPKNMALAICDGVNDISLFNAVKYKIAMGNAILDIKNQSDFVTSTNDENGVNEVLKKILKKI